MATPYEPTPESLRAHAVPDWFADAKLGVFVHWGLYSVPAWADPESDHAYAEWYPFYMHRDGTPTTEYHRAEYGDDVDYLDFAAEFTAENWDPERWAAFFDDVGARYVVMTAEHHDGFPLWDTQYTRYNAATMGPERDLVADLCAAVRDAGLRFAPSYHANFNYYQPGFGGADGHPDFNLPDEIFGDDGFREAVGPGPEYADFMNAKHRELIRETDPDLLWFDTPQADAETVRARELIADFYNRAAARGREVAVNDRAATGAVHADFVTPEYETYDEIREGKWEACRGVGRSFGYNRAEDASHHLSARELVHLFVDVVSKNGNLLINVGPRADGTIPALQKRPLEGLGAWLDRYGAAIYGSAPWVTAEDPGAPVEVRYTHRDGTLYATCFDWPGGDLSLSVGAGAAPDAVDGARHVGGDAIPWTATASGVTLSLPDAPPESAPAYVFALDGVPAP
ncbi:MAG: alpha-L-fucosidase [Halobacteriaceae archaeon]